LGAHWRLSTLDPVLMSSVTRRAGPPRLTARATALVRELDLRRGTCHEGPMAYAARG